MRINLYLTSILIIIHINLASGQDFAPIGAGWYYSSSAGGSAPTNSEYYYLVVEKDTTINDYNLRKIKRTYYRYQGDSLEVSSYFIHQSGDTVSLYNQGKEKLYRLFVFNASPGDTLLLDIPYDNYYLEDTTYRVVIDKIITETYDGVELNKYVLKQIDNFGWFCGFYLEKVGGYEWFLPLGKGIVPEADGPIRCYHDSEVAIKFSSKECDYRIVNSLPEPAGRHWDLFIPGRNSYYKQQSGQSANIENFLADCILVTDEYEVLYFNRKPDYKPECYQAIRNEPYIISELLNLYKIDSLIRLNDSILFIGGFSASPDTFIFKPHAKVNESWMTNGITIKCDESGVMNIFGKQDSIKRFTCYGKNYDGVEFILSKFHGFIKFLPLDEFFYHPNRTQLSAYFELAGFSYEDISVGYKQPDFSDYFKLSAGDILYWREIYDPDDPRIPGSIEYRRDSIIEAFISADSVHYKFQRIIYDEDGKVLYSGQNSSYHLRKIEGVLLQNHTSWYGLKLGDYQPYEVFFFNSLNLLTENNDTITYASYTSPGLLIDTSNCEIGQILDYGFTAGYNTREGIVFQSTYNWGEISATLIGSVVNGIKYGDTNIPTGIYHDSFQDYNVYPNPFIDYITIDSQNAIEYIRIYDTVGNVLKDLNQSADKVFLGELNPGLYILEIVDRSKNMKRIKIIKQ